MKKIVACIVVACLLLGLMTALQLNPERLSDEGLFVDDDPAAVDQQAIYDELFDLGSTVQIDVNLSRDEIARIQQDYTYYKGMGSKSPIYRRAASVTFTINGKKYVIEDVGIRMKGNTTRSNFYDDVLGIYNLVHFKLHFGQTFERSQYYSLDAQDWPDEDARQARLARTFATLQKMELKWNSTADSTYLRTTYMHEMYRDYDIPAQRCVLADLRIGGCRMGVYRLFEPVDETFIHRYFPQNDWGGDLYKVRFISGSPANYTLTNSYGIDSKNNNIYHNFDLKTNQNTSEHESMRHLLAVINKPDLTREELEAAVDIPSFTRFNAINFATGNQDDLRFNYNNHYVYFRKSDGKAVFIPYDCEVCLGDTYSWDPSGDALTGVSPYDERTFRDESQSNPLVRQVVLRDGWFVDEYADCLRELCESKWLTETNYRTYYDTVAPHYADRVLSPYCFMSTIHMDTSFTMEERNGNMTIGDFMKKMRENITQWLLVVSD